MLPPDDANDDKPEPAASTSRLPHTQFSTTHVPMTFVQVRKEVGSPTRPVATRPPSSVFSIGTIGGRSKTAGNKVHLPATQTKAHKNAKRKVSKTVSGRKPRPSDDNPPILTIPGLAATRLYASWTKDAFANAPECKNECDTEQNVFQHSYISVAGFFVPASYKKCASCVHRMKMDKGATWCSTTRERRSPRGLPASLRFYGADGQSGRREMDEKPPDEPSNDVRCLLPLSPLENGLRRRGHAVFCSLRLEALPRRKYVVLVFSKLKKLIEQIVRTDQPSGNFSMHPLAEPKYSIRKTFNAGNPYNLQSRFPAREEPDEQRAEEACDKKPKAKRFGCFGRRKKESRGKKNEAEDKSAASKGK